MSQQGGTSLPLERLDKLFDRFWPDMEEIIANIVKQPDDSASTPKRDDSEILAEILEIVRAQQRQNDRGGFSALSAPVFATPRAESSTESAPSNIVSGTPRADLGKE